MVQIGVPLQSRELYGKPQFWPLWEAAADANLPVAVHIETGEGIGFPPTPSGHTRTYEQYVSFMALNYLYHLMNMIAEGSSNGSQE
ncbi:amidohydrolase family protein [Mycobacterium xenopi 3993]|nr:amidohydrolase family protein [Mycobacterium xenopi 3993]